MPMSSHRASLLAMDTGVYAFRNVVDGKVYIGSASVSLKKRRRGHERDLAKGKHANQFFQNAWNKYGSDSFEFLVLERCPPALCLAREEYWIRRYESANRQRGYNLCWTGTNQSGLKRSEESRRKMSETRKGKPLTGAALEATRKARAAAVGKPLSAEARQSISEGVKRRYEDPEERKKTSEAVKLSGSALVLRRPDVIAARVAALGSSEVRARMSAAHRGKPLSDTHRANLAKAIRSPEVRAKISASLTGKAHAPESVARVAALNRGKKRTDEQRARISAGIKESWARRRLEGGDDAPQDTE